MREKKKDQLFKWFILSKSGIVLNIFINSIFFKNMNGSFLEQNMNQNKFQRN